MNRLYGALTAPEIDGRLGPDAVLCLPFGSYEQHGPHLPLHTDTIIAEGFTARLLERFGDQHNLWSLPTIPFGLSPEHSWTPGTISLRIRVVMDLLDTLVGEIIRATPARKLLIVNGHGGNRGILEAALYELVQAHGVRACAVHPSSLSTVRIESALPEVHAGTSETSVMLALAPGQVHLDRLPAGWTTHDSQKEAIKRLVLDRGATWPWSSGDEQIASLGITGGDPRLGSREIGEAILASAVDASEAVLENL